MKEIKLSENEKVLVYLTVNTKNHKIYVGVHKTSKPYDFDGYIGCGLNRNTPGKLNKPKTHFHYAVKKYGFDAFRRVTIKICDTYEEALKIESMIVDEKFVKSERTYNATLGGGELADCSVPCYQYDIVTGEYLNEYDSYKQASDSMNCLDPSSIRNAARYKFPCKGYLWSDQKIDKINIDEYHISDYKNKKTPIYIYNLDGSFYKEFQSYSDAAKEIGNGSVSDLTRAAKNKYVYHGYYVSFDKIDYFQKPLHKRNRNNPVYQYALDGTFIKEWKNVKEVKEVNGYKKIGDTPNTGKTYYGYQWSYTKYDELPDLTGCVIRARKVGRYDDEGNLLEVFNTMTECQKQYGNVSKVLKGIMQKCKGFRFKYIED